MPRPRSSASRARVRQGRIDVRVGGSPVVALAPGIGRVRVGLVMHPLDRMVDISVQPAAASETLRAAAHRTSTPIATVEAAALGALREARDRCRSWAPADGTDLVAGFGGAAFPLLAAAYSAGCSAVDEVPRWAEAVVSAPTAREGSVAAFGPRSTRPVVRALVSSLHREGTEEIDFSNLALAMIGRDVLGEC